MTLFNRQRIRWKYLFNTLLIFGVCFLLIWLHVFRDYYDIRLQMKIEESLVSRQKTLVGNLIPEGAKLCILPPYKTSESIDLFLSEKQKAYLNIRINSFIGTGDHVWWLVSLGENDVIHLFRMAGVARPQLKSGQCLNQKDIVISFNHKNGYIFFDLSEGE